MIEIENNREQKKQDILQAFRSRKKGFSLKEVAEFLRWKDMDTLEELMEKTILAMRSCEESVSAEMAAL